jgi:hypothetical protein
MVNRSRWLFLGLGICLVLSALPGCAGKGETIYLDLNAALRGAATEQTGRGESVLVEAFGDQRPEKQRLGTRTHLWGGVTHFDVPGSRAGAVVARLVGEYLAKTGRQVTINVVGTGEQAQQTKGTPDVIVTGEVHEFSTHVKSRFFSSVIEAKFRVIVMAKNSADNSSVRLSLEGERSRTVFWFEEKDVEDLINDMLADSLKKLMAGVKVEGRSWVLKN